MPLEERPYYYASFSPENQLRLRKMLVDRLNILSRTYPEWRVAFPSEDSPLDFVHERYDAYVRDINTHFNTTWARCGLLAVFIGTEVGARFVGVDLTGYAESQYSEMDRYYGVLHEISEKWSAAPSGGPGVEWSPEVRLLMLALAQAALFVGANYAAKKMTGSTNPEAIASTAKNMRVIANGVSMKQLTSAIGTGSEQTTDKYGLPVAPGTEADIRALDDEANGPPRGGGGTNLGARMPQAPAMDIGGIIGTINTFSQMFGSKEGGGGGMPGILNTIAQVCGGGRREPSAKESPSSSSPRDSPAASRRASSPPRSRAGGPIYTN